MQLMLYVGGTLVLLVFGVMLTARSNFIRMKTGGGEWILALFVGGALLLLLLRTAFLVESWQIPPAAHELPLADASTTTQIGLALSGVRLDGRSGYLLPFVIVSVHLLVVLIGAAYLARTKRPAEKENGRIVATVRGRE
jgi:NADH:ubiquinone oxidoreductase subunit 6 (subunit J)